MITMVTTITTAIIIPAVAALPTVTLLLLLPVSSSTSLLLCTIVQIKHAYMYHACCHQQQKVQECVKEFIVGNTNKLKWRLRICRKTQYNYFINIGNQGDMRVHVYTYTVCRRRYACTIYEVYLVNVKFGELEHKCKLAGIQLGEQVTNNQCWCRLNLAMK